MPTASFGPWDRILPPQLAAGRLVRGVALVRRASKSRCAQPRAPNAARWRTARPARLLACRPRLSVPGTGFCRPSLRLAALCAALRSLGGARLHVCQLAATNCGAGAFAGVIVVPDRRLRRKAYSAYYDSGFSAQQIQREVLPTYSERNVERLLHEFRANFSWEPIGRTNKRKQNGTHKLGAHGLAALGQMLHDDPTLYLKQLKNGLRRYLSKRPRLSTFRLHLAGVALRLRSYAQPSQNRSIPCLLCLET